jgi:glycine/D-amino acid oxidase-like deaminating enzyme/nitrite reductase/ring-hydroxylating ferredoxin subunit
MPGYVPLARDVTADVCVIGGGLAGVTTAYLLAEQGLSVVLLEALELGSGETGRTTAHIAVPDDRYWHIESSYGVPAARAVAESFAAAINLIEDIVGSEEIDCDFRRLDGYLISCASSPAEALERELLAAKRAGVQATLEPRAPLPHWCDGPALRFPKQAQFHPLKFLAGLARALERPRVAIHTGTHAHDVAEKDGEVTVTTPGGRVHARHAVVATNTPINERFRFHTKMSAHQTYAMAALIRRGTFEQVLMWDDGDPYHYVRLASIEDAEHELLIVGGEDHKTGQERDPDARYTALEDWLRTTFPQAGRIAYRWSGEVMEPLDGIAYLGRDPGSANVFVITGDSGNGMTHATIGALLVSDLIAGRTNPWSAIYDPGRKPLKETLEFLKEQGNNVSQYASWLARADVETVDAIPPGGGALLRQGMQKLAVYRDDAGALYARSATCPHLGCIVQWNAVEKTWDCPCHGSRFSRFGAVMHGPAVTDLALAVVPEKPLVADV